MVLARIMLGKGQALSQLFYFEMDIGFIVTLLSILANTFYPYLKTLIFFIETINRDSPLPF